MLSFISNIHSMNNSLLNQIESNIIIKWHLNNPFSHLASTPECWHKIQTTKRWSYKTKSSFSKPSQLLGYGFIIWVWYLFGILKCHENTLFVFLYSLLWTSLYNVSTMCKVILKFLWKYLQQISLFQLRFL